MIVKLEGKLWSVSRLYGPKGWEWVVLIRKDEAVRISFSAIRGPRRITQKQIDAIKKAVWGLSGDPPAETHSVTVQS